MWFVTIVVRNDSICFIVLLAWWPKGYMTMQDLEAYQNKRKEERDGAKQAQQQRVAPVQVPQERADTKSEPADGGP
jgi:hypothetical protein